MHFFRSLKSTELAVVWCAIFCNAAILAVSAMQLSANTFWFRFLGYESGAIFVSDALYRILLYWPLTAPLWWRVLRRFEWRELVHGRLGWLALASVYLIISAPVAQIDFSAPLEVRRFIEGAIILGLSKPMAAFVLLLSLAVVLPDMRSISGRWLLAATTATTAFAYLLRCWLEGPPIPRLEDEVAYWVQALLIGSGKLIGQSPPPAGIDVVRWAEITLLPYVLRDGANFFGAHQHGWSYILAFFNSFGAAPYANLLLALASIGLLAVTSREMFPDLSSRLQWIAPAALALMPAHFFGAGSMMSHISALCLELAALLCWLSGARSESIARRTTFWLLTIVAVVALCFVRPQSGIAFLFALAGAEILSLWSAEMRGSTDRTVVAIRISVLAFAGVLSAVALVAYGSIFPGGRVFFTGLYLDQHFQVGCQVPGFGSEFGCVPTYGTLGHSPRKLILNMVEILQSLNVDLALFGLPAFLLLTALAAAAWPAIPRGPVALLALLLASHLLIYGVYWHNGGESYRGRYLLDVAYAPALLLVGLLAKLDFKAFRIAPALAVAFLFLTGANLFVQSRGAYVNIDHPPLDSLARYTPQPGNALIASASDLIDRTAPDEFVPGKSHNFSAGQMRAFLNDGAGVIAALAERIDNSGHLRDAHGNYLIGPATDAELQLVARRLDASAIYRLERAPPRYIRYGRGRLDVVPAEYRLRIVHPFETAQ